MRAASRAQCLMRSALRGYAPSRRVNDMPFLLFYFIFFVYSFSALIFIFFFFHLKMIYTNGCHAMFCALFRAYDS